MHKSELGSFSFHEGNNYPSLAGYCLLVRDVSQDIGKAMPSSDEKIGEYIERIVTEAIDAEFRAYADLPSINETALRQWFCPDGPAMKEICNILVRHKKKGWFLSNPFNPSTKRLLNIRVNKISPKEATVSTTEYWYLRWWDEKRDSYSYTYRETNRQTYILNPEQGSWKIFQNLRPFPRTTVPHRWHRSKL